MPQQKISAKELVADIRGGMGNAALVEKYKISAQGLQSIFNKLIAAGALQQAELDNRASSDDRTVNLAWKCPACGKPQSREYDECPDCGVIITKFLRQQEAKRDREIVGQFVEEQLQQERAKVEEEGKKPDETTTTQPSFCHKCGQKLVKESKFCSGCGSQITADSGNDTGPDGKETKPDSKPTWKGGWEALGSLIFFFVFFFYFGWQNMSMMDRIVLGFIAIVLWNVILLIFRAAGKSSSQSTS